MPAIPTSVTIGDGEPKPVNEDYWAKRDRMALEAKHGKTEAASNGEPFTASMVADSRRAMDDDRELPARATLTDRKGRNYDVGLDDDVPGMPGYVVGEIDAGRGVNLLSPQGSGKQDYWVKPVPARHKVTDSDVKKRHAQRVRHTAAARTLLQQASPSSQGAQKALQDDSDYWTEQEKIQQRHTVLGDARGYSSEHIYGHVPDEDIDKAAGIDFDNTHEVRYWDDFENTGTQLFERETDEGEKRYFLQSQDGSVINVTGLHGPPGE